MIDFVFLGLVIFAAVYWLAAFASVVLYRRRRPCTSDVAPSVTMLKPLRGDDGQLYENLRSFVLEAKTAEILVQLSVVAPQGLQHRDGRRNVRGAWPTSPVEHDGRKGREPIDGRKDHQAEKDEINHGRFTARPGCTSQSTGATTSAVLTGIARTSQYRDRRQLSGDRSLMPPIRDPTRRCRASRGVETQNTDEAFWPTFRKGACRASGLGQELYIDDAQGEAVA